MALAADDRVGAAAMTLTDWPSVIVIALSLGSLLVSLASLVVAFKTKQEVKTAARLESRIKAINHIRDALHDLAKDGIVRATTTASIGKALHRSGALLFTRTVRKEIDRAHATAFRLQNVEWRIADRNARGNCCTEKRAADPHSAYEPRGDTAGLGAGCGVRQGGRGKKRPDRGGHHSSSAGRPPQVPRET
jgi:hypothetical protein